MGLTRYVCVAVTMAALLSACSSSSGAGGGAGTGATDATDVAAPGDTTSASAVDGAALDLEGKVDRIVAMLPPGPATRPPDGMFPDATLLAARHVLRAPSPDGFVELWILRIRSPDMGPGIMECRVTASEGSSSAGCSSVAGAPAPERPLVGGAGGDGSSILVELNGPLDMTHFVVTAPTGTIGVVPIEGQALLHLDEACPRDTTVAAWRGEELLRDEPAVFC